MKNKNISFQQRKGRFLRMIGPIQHLRKEYRVKAKLKSLDTKYCAVCFEEDDHCNQDVVNWIQCSQCTMWVHSACSPQSDTQFYDKFICKYCKQRNLTDK